MDGMKWCPAHKDWANLSDFNRRTASKDGLNRICRSCQHKYNKTRTRTHRRRIAQRRANLRIHYGISIEQYNQMFVEQQGCCAVCGQSGMRLVVDHNHRTGDVRKLLCDGCNHGLGRFRDDPALCRLAAIYLETYGY